MHGFYQSVDASRIPADLGIERCPVCKGIARNSTLACSTCKRDAKLCPKFAQKVKDTEKLNGWSDIVA